MRFRLGHPPSLLSASFDEELGLSGAETLANFRNVRHVGLGSLPSSASFPQKGSSNFAVQIVKSGRIFFSLGLGAA